MQERSAIWRSTDQTLAETTPRQCSTIWVRVCSPGLPRKSKIHEPSFERDGPCRRPGDRSAGLGANNRADCSFISRPGCRRAGIIQGNYHAAQADGCAPPCAPPRVLSPRAPLSGAASAKPRRHREPAQCPGAGARRQQLGSRNGRLVRLGLWPGRRGLRPAEPDAGDPWGMAVVC